MKKLIFFLIATLMFVPALLLAQTPDPPTQYESYFATFAALVGVIPFITEWIKGMLNPTGFWEQFSAWVVGILLSLVGYFLHLGIFIELLWYQAIVVGFAASLAANGVFDTGIVEWILRMLGLLKK